MNEPLPAGRRRGRPALPTRPAEMIEEPLEASLREEAMPTRRHVTEPMARAFFRAP
jgi:hypothetical protein